jgi:hypothetical protein
MGLEMSAYFGTRGFTFAEPTMTSSPRWLV